MKNTRTLRISDHALLRWLERVHGIDIEGFRGMFYDELKQKLGEQVFPGNFTAKIGDVAFIIKEGVVTTTLDRSMDSRLKSG